jgi:hypothetical protein
MTTTSQSLPEGIIQQLRRLFPQSTVRAVCPLGPDAGPAAMENSKGIGYGRPMRIELELPDGAARKVVFHTAIPNDFGHDRRSDRAAEMLLAYDTFHVIPNQARALDVGAIGNDGTLRSLADTGEFYLLTEWVEGSLYAEDLRRVAMQGQAQPIDLARAEALARYLAALHALPGTHAGAYVRALRDLLGHGEGIAGIADGYMQEGLGRLWERFFDVYLSLAKDASILSALAPFYAWRALVIASPLWYPHLRAEDRDRILRFAEWVLRQDCFDPALGKELIQ